MRVANLFADGLGLPQEGSGLLDLAQAGVREAKAAKAVATRLADEQRFPRLNIIPGTQSEKVGAARKIAACVSTTVPFRCELARIAFGLDERANSATQQVVHIE